MLKLLFVDPDSTAVGQRVFKINLQGVTLKKKIDLVAAAGVKKAFIDPIPFTISTGKLSLTLTALVGDAILSGLELFPA